MAYEWSESDFFILRQDISQLPTQGWGRLYYLDENTNAISIKEVKLTELSSHPIQTYDVFETDSIQDDTQMMGYSPNYTRRFYLGFPDEVKSGFRQAVDVCRGLPSRAPKSVEAVDSALHAATGISLLSSPLMRELLLFIAIGCNFLPSRRTRHQAETIYTIATAGPPSSESLPREIRGHISYGGDTGSPRAEAGLIRGGWKKSIGSYRILLALTEDAFSRDSYLEGDARDLLNLLIERGDISFSSGPSGLFCSFLVDLANEGSLTVLRLLLGKGGYLPIEKVPQQTRADMLMAAVSEASSANFPNQQPVIAYLLGELKIDPDSQGLHMAGTKPGVSQMRQTALHVAVRNGYTETADLLLQMGASMDAKDEEGRTPQEK